MFWANLDSISQMLGFCKVSLALLTIQSSAVLLQLPELILLIRYFTDYATSEILLFVKYFY